MRKHYIDNLRTGVILLLIPYHAAMAWNTWNEPNYIFFEGNRLISSIIVFFSPYIMPLLFVLAGMSTRYALQKRTIRQYFLERVKKLLVPFLFGTLLFMPVMTYIADKYNYGYEGNPFKHYMVFFTKFTDLTGADGSFSVGQFWFAAYLFVISFVFIGVRMLQQRIMPKLQYINISFWGLCFLGVPLPLLNGLFAVGGKSLLEYMYFFLIGYYIFSKDTIIDEIAKCKWIFFCVGLSATVLDIYLFLWSDWNFSALSLVNTIAKFTSEWFMLIACIGIGRTYADSNGKAARYLTRRSFMFYMLHFIWIVLFQYLIWNIFAHNIILLYIIPVLLAYAVTFLCCEICIRIPFLCFLMGTKYL